MRYRTQAITVAELEGRREEVLNPLPPRAYYNSTDVFFSHGGGEGLRKGGTSRRKLRSNFWTPD